MNEYAEGTIFLMFVHTVIAEERGKKRILFFKMRLLYKDAKYKIVIYEATGG